MATPPRGVVLAGSVEDARPRPTARTLNAPVVHDHALASPVRLADDVSSSGDASLIELILTPSEAA